MSSADQKTMMDLAGMRMAKMMDKKYDSEGKVGYDEAEAAGVDRGVPLMTIFKGVTPFYLSMVVAAILLVVFPEIVTWLVGFL